MKRFAIIMFVLFGNCFGMAIVLDNNNNQESDRGFIVLDNDDDSDNESIGYSDELDELEARINEEMSTIPLRIRQVQERAGLLLQPRVSSSFNQELNAQLIRGRTKRGNRIIERCRTLEDKLSLMVEESTSFQGLLDDLDDVSAVVTILDNESIDYSDEQEKTINEKMSAILLRIRQVQERARVLLRPVGSLSFNQEVNARLIKRKIERGNRILERCRELELKLSLMVEESTSFQRLLDDLDDVSAVVTSLMLDARRP